MKVSNTRFARSVTMVRFTKKVPGKKSSVLRSGEPRKQISCASCGALIRSNMNDDVELCLFCHARMLNEKFHSLKKRSDEDRESLAASEWSLRSALLFLLISAVTLTRWHFRLCCLLSILRERTPHIWNVVELTLIIPPYEPFISACIYQLTMTLSLLVSHSALLKCNFPVQRQDLCCLDLDHSNSRIVTFSDNRNHDANAATRKPDRA